MKKFKERLIGYEGKVYVTMVLLLCLFFVLVISFFSKNIFATEGIKVKSSVTIEEFYENSNPIDLNSIIEQNTSTDIKEEMTVEETDLEYTTRYKTNNDLPNGVIQVLQEGRAGTQKATIIKKYENNELVSEEQVADKLIKAPVERIVEVGTGAQNVDYSINVGEEFHVVSNSVAVRLKADSNSEKICTLSKNDIGTVLTLNDDWCFIASDGIKGYVPQNCIATKVITPDVVPEKTELTKQQLLEKLDINMDLREPSGLTLEQFKKVLSNDANDKNGVFASNYEYFYYIEEQYGVNGIFVASVGIHESGWGTSSISKNKKNLFGYGAVDSNPSGGAYSFNTYSEGIDLLARVFVKYYINPPGTAIYDGTGASGKFYSGSNLSSVNSKYASDKNWASSVYKWMQYLYNKL